MCYMIGRPLIGVRELRQNLSVYLDRVRAGETLTVTDRNQIVAVLAPASRDEDTLARLIAEGRAAPPTRQTRPAPLRTRSTRPLSRLVRELGEDVI
jgi:prevent-host-death family protein